MTSSLKNAVAAIAIFAIALLPFAPAIPAYAAAPNWDATGSYVVAFDLGGTPYAHDLSLTQTGASLAGSGGNPAGGAHVYTWVLTSGNVDGDTITFTANYTATPDAVVPQTTMIVTGTIAGDGTMSGTWSDNYQGGARNGTWMTTSGTADPIAQTVCSTMTLSSDTGTTYKGMTTTDPAGSSTDGLFTGGPAAAVVAGPDGYPGAWDTAGLNPLVLGASWVNNTSVAPSNPAAAGGDGTVNTWRLFGESFTLPAGATVSSASVSFSADNSANAFYDDVLIGSVADFNTITTSAFGATAGTHELEFVTKNDAFDGAQNPTAVIYKATIEYCEPVVVDPTPVEVLCPAQTTKTFLETVNIPSTSAVAMLSSNVLANGTSYILKAYGTADAGDGIEFDAKYSFRTPTSATWTDSVSTYEGAGPTLLDLFYNGTTPWGAYSSTHVYEALVAGNSAQAQFLINDSYPPNNTGELKVDISACVPDAPVAGTISGMKFWDVNGNGVKELGEPGLSGWTFNLATGPSTGSQVTGDNGAYTFTNVLPGSYTMTETMQSGWTQTATPAAFTLAAGENKTGVDIGNACFVTTGAKGKGFWTNKNGDALAKDGGNYTDELNVLNALNLRDAAGAHYNPGLSYANYKTWNTNANAVNMSYMLSAQLSALALSREANLINGTKQIVITDPALASITIPLGLITINALIAEADAALGLDGSTPAGDTNRAYQEALKNAVEKALEGNVQLCMPFAA